MTPEKIVADAYKLFQIDLSDRLGDRVPETKRLMEEKNQDALFRRGHCYMSECKSGQLLAWDGRIVLAAVFITHLLIWYIKEVDRPDTEKDREAAFREISYS